MMTTPPLPEPSMPTPDIWVREDFGLGDSTLHVGYTADQMQQYAAACVAAERADAERYRWLRDSHSGAAPIGSLCELWLFSRPTASAIAIDAAIDAARAPKEQTP